MSEIDRRKLYADAGFHSMFAYCVGRLHYSEGETARRIHAARAAARHPEILSFLRDGTLSLTAVSLLAPHQRREDFLALLSRAQGLSQNKLELLLAEIAPERARRDCIRYLGHPPLPALPPREELFAGLPDSFLGAESSLAPGDPSLAGTTPATAPLLAEGPPFSQRMGSPSIGQTSAAQTTPVPTPKPLVRFSFTADEGLLTWVERARDLLRHKYPYARLEDIFREALEDFLDHRDPGRKLARKRERENKRAETATEENDSPFGRALDRSRRIPQRVRDRVWERDAGRCAFTASDGHRCGTTGMLEFDHIIPWAQGGLSDDPDNIRLLCRTHNRWAARAVFISSRWPRPSRARP
ncbi:MAG: HNH endonuclease [Elusimicrobia bacterium]|nr:HNH endonuclease [Elusimicrobiota bacterium]